MYGQYAIDKERKDYLILRFCMLYLVVIYFTSDKAVLLPHMHPSLVINQFQSKHEKSENLCPRPDFLVK